MWKFCNWAYKTADLTTWCLLHCCCGVGQIGSVGVFSLKNAKKNSAGAKFFFLSLKGWLFCSATIHSPIPRVIFKLPLLTCQDCTEKDTQVLTARFHSPPLPFSSCPQLLALASNTTLRLMVTTCAGKSSTQQGPSTPVRNRETEGGSFSINTGFPGWDLPVCGTPRVLYG